MGILPDPSKAGGRGVGSLLKAEEFKAAVGGIIFGNREVGNLLFFYFKVV